MSMGWFVCDRFELGCSNSSRFENSNSVKIAPIGCVTANYPQPF